LINLALLYFLKHSPVHLYTSICFSSIKRFLIQGISIGNERKVTSVVMTIPVMIVNCLSVHVCPVVVFNVNRCVL